MPFISVYCEEGEDGARKRKYDSHNLEMAERKFYNLNIYSRVARRHNIIKYDSS